MLIAVSTIPRSMLTSFVPQSGARDLGEETAPASRATAPTMSHSCTWGLNQVIHFLSVVVVITNNKWLQPVP